MNKSICIIFLTFFLSGFMVPDSVLSALKFWLVQPAEYRAPLEKMEFAHIALNEQEAQDVIDLLMRWKASAANTAEKSEIVTCVPREQIMPDSITWTPSELEESFKYWLAVPVKDIRPGAKIAVKHIGNVFEVTECDYIHFTIRVNDKMVDINKPIHVVYKRNKLFKKRVVRTVETIYRTMEEQVDSMHIFTAEMKLSLLPEERQGSDVGAKIWKVASMFIPN